MKYKPVKLGKAVWEYRNMIILYDDQRPAGWFFTWHDNREYFGKRSEAQRQIDRYLATLTELAAAPNDTELARLDLTLYIDHWVLTTVQRKLSTLGIPRTKAALAALAHSRPGRAGPGKRIMLAVVIARLLGLNPVIGP